MGVGCFDNGCDKIDEFFQNGVITVAFRVVRKFVMGRFLKGFALPILLLTAASLNWSLMSLVDLLAFLFAQYAAPKNGFRSQRQSLLSWCTLVFSSLSVLSHAIFHIVWAVKGDQWSISDAQWAKLVGFLSVHSWGLPYVFCFMAIQVSTIFIAVIGIYGSRFHLDQLKYSWLRHLFSSVTHIGSHLKVLCCLLLPVVQLVAASSHPSWLSLPFFVCSSVGLINWSTTSNFLALFQWWSYLLLYAGFNIILLYAYQLPVKFPGVIQSVAGFIGLYKISAKSEWSEICSCLSLLLFYIMLSWIRCDLTEMDFIISTRESSLTEQLLLPKHSFFIHESRSGVRHANVMLRGAVFRTFSVNFFAYGLPISLLALSCWSFHFASIFAFGLLVYVGYSMIALPSLFHLHHLSSLLLIFILLWAASTYIFSVAFTFLNKKTWKDMEIWENVGLWHYPIPGVYLLAQFCLGVLVALGNLVNNSIFLYLSDRDRQSSSEDFRVEESEETKVLIIATISWGLRKSSRAIALVLIFFNALKPGIIHAVYMVFFLLYLLSHTISWKIRQSLIVLCVAHFALLYILQLNLITQALEQKGSFAAVIMSQLGFLNQASCGDFLRIAALACFCAVHNHGFEMLSSFSAILQNTPCHPIGFRILRAGLIKSVLLSNYTSPSKQSHVYNSSREEKIVSYLRATGQKFLSVYRSYGTYIAFLTILPTVYLVQPNFTSFGYLFFLQLWMNGRQLLGRTKRRLWLPLKVYAVLVFILIYGCSVCFSFQKWLSRMVDVSCAFGYKSKASMLENVWQSLAVLIVMQLYSYERRHNTFPLSDQDNAPEKRSFSFVKRLLILHSEKILHLALFYAALSPVSAFGFLYIIGLAVCSTLPKSSQIPSKLFLVYSGFLVMFEYLFQLWGDNAEMFPGQENFSLSLFLGLQFYKPGFLGLESGLRGKVFVIVSCILRYNVFHWLERTPYNFGDGKTWEEPHLFSSREETPRDIPNHTSKSKHPIGARHLLEKQKEGRSHSWPSFRNILSQGPDAIFSDIGGFEGSNMGKYLNNCGSSKESHKWNRKRVHILRKERLYLQMTTLKACMKFWIENVFNLFGLEINMVALLLASFAVLNSISLLYVASLAACILLPRHVMRKLWPIFVFLFGSVIILEYLAIWLNQTSGKQYAAGDTQIPCNACWRNSHLYFDYCKKCWLEQIGAIVQEEEKRAAWKTSQLQQIQKSEEEKRLRNLQVEKMKSDILNLQIQLQSINVSQSQGNMWRNSSPRLDVENSTTGKGENDFKQQDVELSPDLFFSFGVNESPRNENSISPLAVHSRKHSMEFLNEITELSDKAGSGEFLDSHERDGATLQAKTRPLVSAVHLFSDGVSQMQSLSNMAVSNIVSYLNIKREEPDLTGDSSDEEVFFEIENKNIGCEPVELTFSMQSDDESTTSDDACLQIGMILRYMWAQMRSNNDIVCYCCFVLIFMWNFSLFSMVYPAILFLYALCVSTGPNNMFWVIMLIYTEMAILVQYIYQIIIQHCGLTFKMSLLQELGFPAHKIMSSFVISNLPLFVVYLFTLLQTSITRDSEWAAIAESFGKRRNKCQEQAVKNCRMRIERLLFFAKNFMKQLVRSLYRYWKSLTQGAETPPYFVQLSMKVDLWPQDGIQPEGIKSGINKLLKIMHDKRCQEMSSNHFHSISVIRIHSIERSLENENDNVALAVLEVLYAASFKQCSQAGFYQSLTPAADVAYEILEAQRAGVIEEIGFPYPILSVIGGGKKHIDLYAYTFCADLAVFFLVAIFYQSVMKNNSEFLEVYQLEDQFPKEFVFILMGIFFLIVLDRIIYLCSFATGKVIFYLFNFVLFTCSVTKYAWNIELRNRHAARFALCAIYFTKAISLSLQAIQIRFGIPHKSTLYRQFLTSSISQVNYFGFRLYRALPFLYELRCVLDWSCTTTSLTMYDWLKLEDIHANLFLVKCDVDLNRSKHQQGEKQSKMTKFCNGICLFFVLMCVIWTPMLMYSSGNPTNIANPIKEASIRIDIRTSSGRLTLFETTLCEKISWDEISSHNDMDPGGYLSAYDEKDIQLICCQADASTLFLVPPVVLAGYTNSLRWSMDIIFSWQLTRDRPKGKEVVRYELIVQDEDLPTYLEVMAVLNGSTNSFRIYNVYPRYFRVTGSGEVRLLEELVDLVSGDLVLNSGNPKWWSFHDINVSSGCGDFAGPTAIIVSEETPQGILGETLSKFSIWGLYITFVLAVGRFIRLQCSDLRMRIPFENLPSCDRLLAICEDIYAARAEGELEVEEVLYWTLVKIYRSPQMLLECT
ncbi:piezo-type mechanosensitive ion channel homolog isoform X4 [Manihot esculenta]|uniref:piezo-type mechanosensitive ion channel homolog isoform X4 n=1 Tax=Manihot esculenta TaxID=3983 RepID=UPI001CC5E40B|nr:piezo-type mechanosensitive ion channel homolog isoform X4 [Manihot esculenta]